MGQLNYDRTGGTSAPAPSSRITLDDQNDANSNPGIGATILFDTVDNNDIGLNIVGNTFSFGTAGGYKVAIVADFFSSSARSNVGVDVYRNGSFDQSLSGNNYIRATGGHNEAHSTYVFDIEINPGEESDTFEFRYVRQSRPGIVRVTHGSLYVRAQ